MKKDGEKKKHNLSIRISEDESVMLHEKFNISTFRSFAEYIRALIFHTPFVTTVRSLSLDEFLPIAGGIQEQLAGIRRDFTRAVKDLQGRPANAETTETLTALRSTAHSVDQNIDAIRQLITKIYNNARPIQDLRGNGVSNRVQ